jgi:hypothetical protein
MPRHIPKKNKNIGLDKILHINIQRSIIHNSKKMEKLKCPSN